MDAVKGLERNIVTFGLTSKADVYAKKRYPYRLTD